MRVRVCFFFVCVRVCMCARVYACVCAYIILNMFSKTFLMFFVIIIQSCR